ncbi:hypothetical protein [Lichenicoccus sp.]|uniref:hypothetical protein n=1 Tax=Lichenicoccus sp. TaxID=2781899 RepID=UPI003D1307E9
MADDIFKEVDEDLRAERFRAAGRRAGALGVIVVVLAAAGVGVWQFETYQGRQKAAATAATFFAAGKLADSGAHPGGGPNPSSKQAASLFAEVASRRPEGFRTLARFRLAQIAWEGGQTVQALAYWNAIDEDASADPTLRGLASLLWVQHQVADGDAALLESRLGALSRPGGPWRPLAQELDAELDLRLGHVAEARRKLAALSTDGSAPEGLRNRASGLEETLGTAKTGG